MRVPFTSGPCLPALGFLGGAWSCAGFQLHIQLPHHVAAETIDRSLARERDQGNLARLSRLKPHRGAGGDVEAHAAGLLALELQGRIGLEEMVVRADLDRSVAAVGDGDLRRLAPRIELNLAVLDEHFAGGHSSSPSKDA